MAETLSKARAELVHRLQALTQHAAADDALPLPHLADKLADLVDQMRRAGHISAAPADATAAGAPADSPTTAQPSKKQRRAPRDFDFSRYRSRFVALELMYVGWGFQGFARQENTENTIEGVLFAALRKVKLIPEASVVPLAELNYSRCGRTDRGVSALGQVVALRLRSVARVDEPEAPLESEYDYPRLVNKALPPEVRVLGWTPVPDDFNARFSAQYREYKYFIVRQRLTGPSAAAPAAAAAAAAAGEAGPTGSAVAAASASATAAAAEDDGGERRPAGASASGVASDPDPGRHPDLDVSEIGSSCCAYSLDIDAMRVAAARFIGEHDFRNFCKPDVTSVRSFRRRILSFRIEPVGPSAAHQVFALTVRGSAFLWHQVRCMAAVLLMVGRGQERPEVVSELLDVGATPRKPQYSMAPEEPLLLYACGFSGLSFRRSGAAVEAALANVGALLQRHLVGAALTAACHSRISGDERCPAASGDGGGGGRGIPAAAHIPLRRRPTEPSIEERMARRGLPWPPEPRGAAEGAAATGPGPDEDDDAMGE